MVEVTTRLPFSNNHPSEVDGKLAVTPGSGFARIRGAHLRIAERLLPNRPSFVRTNRSPDGRFDPTRCRHVYSSWHRKPSRCRFADFPSDPPRRLNPSYGTPRTQLPKKHRVGPRAVAAASRRLSNGQILPLQADVHPICSFTDSIRIRASL